MSQVITIDANVRIIVTSSTNAEYPQRFILERESADKPDWWETMGNLNGGQSGLYLPLSRISRWKISGLYYNGKGWPNSAIRLRNYGTKFPKFDFNDSYPNNDFDDLIVQLQLIYPGDAKVGGIEFKDFDSKATGGDGVFKYHSPLKNPPPLDPSPGKGKIPNKIIIEF